MGEASSITGNTLGNETEECGAARSCYSFARSVREVQLGQQRIEHTDKAFAEEGVCSGGQPATLTRMTSVV
jgi:hypothetical protein